MASNDCIIQLDKLSFAYPGRQPVLRELDLAMSPEVLLLDEPTSGLDETTKHRLKHILQQLDLSYILISHEFDFMAETVTAFYTLQDGKIVEDTERHPHFHEHAHPLGRQPHEH